jgi:pimeloyl-ACP methyl ester carboxylesterase
MGAWLALIATKLHQERIIGIITLAAAIDFTETLIWDKLTPQEKEIIQKKTIYEIRGNNPECNHLYPVSYKLIEDGRKYLMINDLSEEKIDIFAPIHLIHGMEDIDVPYNISLKVAARLKSKKVVIKLIKDANHKLSRKEDLDILFSSIDELIKLHNV